jgi:hypothetical protein
METSEYFDINGRCIPSGIKAEYNQETRRYFICEQPIIEYEKIHTRLVKHLKIDNPITVSEFTNRAEDIIKKLNHDPQCKNILNGVCVPFMLPKDTALDLGDHLESKYLNAVKESFEESYPNRTFVNHHKGSLSEKFSIAKGSRHDQLVNEMSQQQVVGYYFPCLTECSVPAAIELIKKLPSKFILAGGYDTAAALIGTPDLLLRSNGYPPLLWLAGLKAESDGVGYHFEAYGYNLTFNRRVHFDKVAESWTCGIVVIG